MARPKKATVDYFPHVTDHGKTMFILESRFGNDGYAVFFKILEQLGKSKSHYIDCNESATWEFLAAYCRVSSETLNEILNMCSSLGAIDSDLWSSKVIYSQNFVDGIVEAYRLRKMEIPTKENVSNIINSSERGFLRGKLDSSGVSNVINGEMKLNEIRLNEMKIKESTAAAENKLSVQDIQNLMGKHLGRLTINGGQIEAIRKMSNDYPAELIRRAFETAGGAGADRLNWVVKWLEDPKNRSGEIIYDFNEVFGGQDGTAAIP